MAPLRGAGSHNPRMLEALLGHMGWIPYAANIPCCTRPRSRA